MSTEEVLPFSSIEVVQMVRAERDGSGERLYLNFEFEMGLHEGHSFLWILDSGSRS